MFYILSGPVPALRLVSTPDVRIFVGSDVTMLWELAELTKGSVFIRGPAGLMLISFKHGAHTIWNSTIEAAGNGQTLLGFTISEVELEHGGSYNITMDSGTSANASLFVFGMSHSYIGLIDNK